MEKEIPIYNPKAAPYGPLSNIYNSQIILRDKEKRNVWKNVSEFIYSNLLKNKSSIKRVREKKPNYAKLFRKYYDLEKKAAIRQALQIAYDSLLKNEDKKQLVLGIKEKNIVYTSKNSFWNKENMIGEILESLRKRVENQAEKEMVVTQQNILREDLYYLYLVAKLLQSNFSKFYLNIHNYRESGSIKELLTKFTGKTEEKIYQELSNSSISKARFIELIKESMKSGESSRFKNLILLLISVNHESNHQRKVSLLIDGILKFNIKVYVEELKRYRDNFILSQYLTYFFRKQRNNPDSEIYNASDKEIEELKFESIRSPDAVATRQKVLRLYHEQKLPQELMKSISGALSEHKLPSRTEIEHINDFRIPRAEKEAIEKINRTGTFILSGERPYDQKYKPLLPFAEQKDFTVDKLKFPTVMHYVYYYLFKNFLQIQSNPLNLDPYALLKSGTKFESYMDIKRKFNEKSNELIKYKKRKFAVKGINIKFQKRDLQDLLLSTGKYNLVWGDRSDRFLGVGVDGEGKNAIGKILEEKRKRIKEERKTEPKVANIRQEDVTELVNSNTIIKNWLKLKITDLCKLYSSVNYYYIYVYGEELPPSKMCKKIQSEEIVRSKRSQIITESSILSILINSVYTPCSNIYHYKKDVDTFPPLWFITYVKANKNFEKADVETINVIWKHVIVLIFYIIKHSLRTETDIVDVVAKSTFYLQNEDLNLCGDYNFGENFSTKQKNILLAIFNCIKKLMKFEDGILKCIGKEKKLNLSALLQTAKNLILGIPKAIEVEVAEAVEVLPFCDEEVCDDIKEQAFRLPSEDLLRIAEQEGIRDRTRSRSRKYRRPRIGQSTKDENLLDQSGDFDLEQIVADALGIDTEEVSDRDEEEDINAVNFSEQELYFVKKYIESNFSDMDDETKSKFSMEAVKTMHMIENSKHFSYSRINFFC